VKLIFLFLMVASMNAFAFEPSSDFEDVGKLTGVKIDLRYGSKNNFLGQDIYGETLKNAYLHKDAVAKLKKAIENLHKTKPEWKLLIFDALRPRSAQKLLFAKVEGTPQQSYVASPKSGSIHNYGFAVDLSLVDEKDHEIDMGTGFDSFEDLAQPRFEQKFLKEGKLTALQIANRKILRAAMNDAGFRTLPNEWWHFDAISKEDVRKAYKIVE
jgi:D-alanyl-D-alanine dipeptidase